MKPFAIQNALRDQDLFLYAEYLGEAFICHVKNKQGEIVSLGYAKMLEDAVSNAMSHVENT